MGKVKKIKEIIVVVTTILVFHSFVDAQSYLSSEINVWIGGGSSALKYQIDKNESKSAFGLQLGAGYSKYFNKTFGVSIGLEIEMLGSSFEKRIDSLVYDIKPPQGLPEESIFKFKAFYNNFEEKQTAVLLQIPVMLNFQFPVSDNGLLFLGTGIKAGIPVSSKWNQNTGKLTTTAYSDFTNQTYSDIPNHGFSTLHNLSKSDKLELKSPVFLCLEGGYKFGIEGGKYLYVGAFLDYGLNDIYKATTFKRMLEYKDATPGNFEYSSILATEQFSVADGIKPFAAGVKIKLGIGGGKEMLKTPRLVKESSSLKLAKPEPVWGW